MEVLNFQNQRCLDILNENEPLIFPTETVYGIGVRFDSELAFHRLVAFKKRPPDKPFTLMISEKEQVMQFAHCDAGILRVVDKYFPGEITLILEAKETFPWVTLGQKTIGIRMSGAKEVRDLIHRLGVPMLVTSVNRSGEIPCVSFSEIVSKFKDEIKGIVVEDTLCCSQKPSTIIRLDQQQFICVREGNIKKEEIEKIWRNENENSSGK